MKNHRCPNCDNNITKDQKPSNKLYAWLGFSNKCMNCNSESNKILDTRSILLLVSVVLAFQVVVSLFLYPVLTAFILDYNLLISSFIVSHVLLVPFYIKFGFSFIAVSYNQ